jgi:hypothetical protein
MRRHTACTHHNVPVKFLFPILEHIRSLHSSSSLYMRAVNQPRERRSRPTMSLRPEVLTYQLHILDLIHDLFGCLLCSSRNAAPDTALHGGKHRRLRHYNDYILSREFQTVVTVASCIAPLVLVMSKRVHRQGARGKVTGLVNERSPYGGAVCFIPHSKRDEYCFNWGRWMGTRALALRVSGLVVGWAIRIPGSTSECRRLKSIKID